LILTAPTSAFGRDFTLPMTTILGRNLPPVGF
jgi:hypothetical protein